MLNTFSMDKAKLFTKGRSQAVQLPEEYRFEGTTVLVRRLGSAVILLPEDKAWDFLFETVEGFTSDFMADREQPPLEERERTEAD